MFPGPFDSLGGDFLENTMAKASGEVRISINMACEDCKRRNYTTYKNKRNNPDRLELKKYCRWCGTHTNHREAK